MYFSFMEMTHYIVTTEHFSLFLSNIRKLSDGQRKKANQLCQTVALLIVVLTCLQLRISFPIFRLLTSLILRAQVKLTVNLCAMQKVHSAEIRPHIGGKGGKSKINK